MRRVLIEILIRVAQRGKGGVRIVAVWVGRRAGIGCQAKILRDGVVHLPGNLGRVELLEDTRYIQLRQVIVAARIKYQALRSPAGKSSNAIGNTLAGDWREPAIGDG